MEVAEDASKARKSRTRKRNNAEDDYNCGINPSTEARRINSVILANTKPSFCLKRGIGSLHKDHRSLQSEHRRRLRRLLEKLMRQHKYAEASGVLSVLLKGTTKESAVFKTRTKFMVLIYSIYPITLFHFGTSFFFKLNSNTQILPQLSSCPCRELNLVSASN